MPDILEVVVALVVSGLAVSIGRPRLLGVGLVTAVLLGGLAEVVTRRGYNETPEWLPFVAAAIPTAVIFGVVHLLPQKFAAVLQMGIAAIAGLASFVCVALGGYLLFAGVS
jgi:hypothetical protein